MTDKKIIYSIWLFVGLFFQLGCQTAQKSEIPHADLMKWESRARIKDMSKSKSQSVNVEIVGQKSSQQVRMDMSAVMGVPVASIVMDEKNFSMALYRQKKFYEGPMSERVLRPVLKTSMSPKILMQVLFDENISGADWKCQKDEVDQLANCHSQSQKMSIEWLRKPEMKTVKIKQPEIEIQWVFENPSTEVQVKESTFQLSVPSGFKVIRL